MPPSDDDHADESTFRSPFWERAWRWVNSDRFFWFLALVLFSVGVALDTVIRYFDIQLTWFRGWL
jgi:hypothetical protein